MLADIGFLDPEFFMTFEDLDLSFRGQLRGYECVFIPRAIVYHRLGATRKKNPAQDVFFSQRNIELAYLKNMPLGLILGSLLHRLAYELGGAAYFTKLGVGTAFFKAKIDAIRRLPSVLRKRAELQRRRILTNEQLRALLLRYRVCSKWKKFSSAWRVQ
jgi:GT2 family glycosyltransferase